MQQGARQVDCAEARHTGAQEDRQQLRIGQRFGTAREQFLAGALALGPVGDRHEHEIRRM